MFEGISAVWGAVGNFFTGPLKDAVDTIVAVPVLVAPVVIGVSGMVLGSAKRLLKVGRRK